MGVSPPEARHGARGTAVFVALGVTAALVWGAAKASGAVGDLSYQGCLTGETETVANGACASVGVTTLGGLNSGYDNVRSTAVSPDGASLYATALADSSISSFSRDPATGALTPQGCITGETQSAPPCTALPSALSGGNNSGMSGAQAAAISPDGTSVYATAQSDDAVVRFDRDPSTGALSYQGCITGEDESGPGPVGSDACTEIPDATSGGDNSGLDDPQSIAVTNNSLYVAARGDDAVARFDRAAGGALTYQGCLSGETQTGPAGTNACTLLLGASSFGSNSGLDVLQNVALSPDGTSLYTASQGDSAVGRFDRNTSTGALIYQGCITGEQESGPPPPITDSGACAEIPTATSTGNNSGMLSTYAIVVSLNGASLYTVSENDDALVRFDRAAGGALSYTGCITGKTEAGPGGTNACLQSPSAQSNGTNSGLDKLRTVVPSADGRSVYVSAAQDDAVTRFSRDPGSGAVAYVGCITAETETGPAGTNACPQIPSATTLGGNSGLDNPQAIAVSPDAASLYVGAANDAGIARFDLEQPEPGPQPQPGPQPKADRTLTLDANKGKVKKGKKVRFSGQIDAPQNEAGCEPNQTVELQRKKKKAPDSAFATFATLQSNNSGKFDTKVKVKKTRVYRAVVAETETCDDEVSNTKKVRVKKKK